MPKGLTLPLGVDRYGRAKTLSGTEQLEKLLRTGLSFCTSNNPFQSDLGLDPTLIFDITSPEAEGAALDAIKAVFKIFRIQGRAELSPPIEFERGDGKLIAHIKYIDLEAEKESELYVPIPAT